MASVELLIVSAHVRDMYSKVRLESMRSEPHWLRFLHLCSTAPNGADSPHAASEHTHANDIVASTRDRVLIQPTIAAR